MFVFVSPINTGEVAADRNKNNNSSHSSTQKPSHGSGINGGGGGGSRTPLQPIAAPPALGTAASKAPKTTAERRSEFAIRPGYSSGASSYDGSVGGDDFMDEEGLRVSRHSDILALSELRQEMVAEGDLAKTVVRIEVSRSLSVLFYT